jgi:hypothetical protein
VPAIAYANAAMIACGYGGRRRIMQLTDYDSSAKACDMSFARGVDPNEHDADRPNAISQRLAGPHCVCWEFNVPSTQFKDGDAAFPDVLETINRHKLAAAIQVR